MVDQAKTPVEETAWETISGLVDDVDGWIKSAKFGFKDEYAKVAGMDSPLLILTLVNEEGEEIASPGYSCGSGWVVQEDGARIEHPLRSQIVKTSVYGQLIDRVVKKIAVKMNTYGSPLTASTWEGLGFHWKQEAHATLSQDPNKKTATQLMPSEFLGEWAAATAGAANTPGKATEVTAAESSLKALVESSPDIKVFQKAALKLPAVTGDDDLMARVLDDGPDGVWAKLKAKN